MDEKRLKEIVEECVGNNDPFWNEPVYEVVMKIISFKDGEESSIRNLLPNVEKYGSKQIFEITETIYEVCSKLEIKLENKHPGAVVGLPWNTTFVKRYDKNSNKKEEKNMENIYKVDISYSIDGLGRSEETKLLGLEKNDKFFLGNKNGREIIIKEVYLDKVILECEDIENFSLRKKYFEKEISIGKRICFTTSITPSPSYQLNLINIRYEQRKYYE